ncbi:hypothetical protein KHQ06_25065 [Nocardia tengchongensis]|uniref:Pyridoxine 5'-phosphate oxidase dimerisation C-terminal domain-containing protein n=1 Tax=Nocardia tengchongensis TaxID=2055889 RepID=A0ABX8CI25_9NOCA|nr:pyridoxine 5'-phosphate oxidase C-terminal domain-containing protein [Nocardia tengchongensis]QVI19624.1 hypothetical protein KHQ06_25065 [Nocardia tengchongensis]
MTFYWPELVRQIRNSGPVVADPTEVAAADFLARPIGSRQMALTRRQSQPFNDYSELDEALDRAGRELEIAPDQVPTEWMSYAVQPDEIEFWQGDPARRHKRVLYRLVNGVWSRNLLWP